jgi:2-iminobutanoate/2-iminopropanoate deaminase
VIVAGETVYVSGLPPFDPQTGEIKRVPFARQSELVLEQMRRCLEAAGSSLDRILKCNVYCTPDESHFSIFNEIYSRYFPAEAPARISCMYRRGRVPSTSKSIALRQSEP